MPGQVISAGKNLFSWLALFRLGASARGILPFLLGAVIAWSRGNPIDWLILLLSSAAVLCIMLMTFLVNEYYDYDTDIANKGYHLLSGGSRILPMGLIPHHLAIIAAYVFLAAAGGIGLWLYFGFKTGPLTIPLGAIAIITGYFYTAKPLQLAYRGWGEIAIWFTCGWLATISGYYLQTGSLNAVATLVSLPGAVSVFLVILMNEIPDIKSDKLSGKNNLAVRLGREKAGILYTVLLILCYVNIIVNIFFGVPVISAYLSVILLPLIIWNVRTVFRQGLTDREVLESLSLRTMVFDHLITVIYAVSFVVAGLTDMELNNSQLIILAAAFIIVFGLEGLGIACSRAVLSE
ncbi:MAG: prenyltransferase [Dehalococcoidales bacterium]|jgi:1,4-dihydroxy-2-naphthoate octaprenyltransferase